jgi:hypothetical protein
MTVLDRVSADAVTARARDIQFRQVALAVLAAVLFAVGWSVAKSFTVAWLVVAWCAVAVKMGWVEGRRKAGERTRARGSA